MKRLAAQTGITYFTVLAAAFYLTDFHTIILCCVLGVLIIIFFSIRKIRQTIYVPCMAVVALIACLVNLGYSMWFVYPVEQAYAGGTHAVSARLVEEPYKSYSMYYYHLRTERIDDTLQQTDLLLRAGHSLDMEPDDTVLFTAELEAVDSSYFRAKGYRLQADSYLLEYEVIPAQDHTPRYYAIWLRRQIRRAFNELLPEDCSALSRAVFIGDKYALELSVREQFRYAGASYYIVVSGMHFAVLSLLVARSLKKLHLRWLSFSVTLMFIIAYMAVTGFQPSVVRAGIMIGFTTLGMTMRRQAYPLNHLGFSGFFATMILSPYSAGDIGLILSFYATFSILLWSEPIAHKLCFKDRYGTIYAFRFLERFGRMREEVPESKKVLTQGEKRAIFFKKLYNTVISQASVCLAANILVIPITVCVFRAVSLVTLLSSLVLYLPIYWILVFSILIAVLFWCGPLRYLAMLLAWPLFLLCRYVLWLVDVLSRLPFAYIHVGSWYVYVWLGVTVVLAAGVALYRNGYRYLPFAVLGSAVVLMAGILANGWLNGNTLRLEVYDCGDGLCAGVNCGGHLYLFSMDGRSKAVYDVLRQISEAYGGASAVLCADDDSFSRCLDYASPEFAISRYLLYDKIIDDTYPEDVVAFNGDSTFLLEDDLVLYTSVNDGVVVPYIRAGEKEILLIPDGCALSDIPLSFRSPDVAVLTTAFDGAEDLSCTDMIISGSQTFSWMTADRLQDCYENVYLTCEGDIRLIFK